jgi:hypothetical protein
MIIIVLIVYLDYKYTPTENNAKLKRIYFKLKKKLAIYISVLTTLEIYSRHSQAQRCEEQRHQSCTKKI